MIKTDPIGVLTDTIKAIVQEREHFAALYQRARGDVARYQAEIDRLDAAYDKYLEAAMTLQFAKYQKAEVAV